MSNFVRTNKHCLTRHRVDITFVSDAAPLLVEALHTTLGHISDKNGEMEDGLVLSDSARIKILSLDPKVTKWRDMVGMPKFASLYGITIGSQSNDMTVDISPFQSMLKNIPEWQTKLEMGSISGIEGKVGRRDDIKMDRLGIKEIVIPSYSSHDVHSTLLDGVASGLWGQKTAGVFGHISEREENTRYEFGLRIWPTPFPSIVLDVEDIHQVISLFGPNRVEILGQESLNNLQARLVHPVLSHLGIDIRLCANREGPLKFFNESSDVMVHGLLPGVQSNRIFGGDSSIRETKGGHFGDCWNEFREMVRTNPSKFLTERGGQGKISGMPSLKE